MNLRSFRVGDAYETYAFTQRKANKKLYHVCTYLKNGEGVCEASSTISEDAALDKCKRKYKASVIHARISAARKELNIKRLTQQKRKELIDSDFRTVDS